MGYAAEGSVKVMLPSASFIGDPAMSDTISVRDLRAIVDTLHRERAGALEIATDAKDAGDGYNSGVMIGHAEGLRKAIHALEAILNASERTCTECGIPSHWRLTRAGVCRQCHAEKRAAEEGLSEEARGY